VTGPGPAKEPWGDERLAAAYRAAFDVTPPRNLEDRVETALASGPVRRRPGTGWLRWSSVGAVGAVAAVAVVAVALLVSNGLPYALPGGTATSGATPTLGSSPVVAPAAEFPRTIFGIDVLSVTDALDTRDRRDSTEIAVAGWYAPPEPVPCPAPLPPVVPLLNGDCSIDFTWLMAAPETVRHMSGNSLVSIGPPAGPAVNVVFDGPDTSWALPDTGSGERARTPVVFIGHFADARADGCQPADRPRCLDRFVVDQVPWVDGSAYDAVFPADIDGIPVWTVEATLRRGDAGETHGVGVAIGGWYAESVSISISCPPPIEAWSPLERYCHAGQEFLTDIPQTIDVKTPPTGTGLAPFFSPFWGGEFLADRQTPQPVVLVGHFDDPLAISCSHLGRYACISVFVVDRIAWHDGEPQGARTGSSYRTNAPVPTRDGAAVEEVVRRSIAEGASIQSMTLLEERDVTGLDPTTDVDPNGLDLVWYVRAVEMGTHRIGSFIVDDASGELIWSAFPLPPASELP